MPPTVPIGRRACNSKRPASTMRCVTAGIRTPIVRMRAYGPVMTMVTAVAQWPVFDCDALYDALDHRRRTADLSWYELADELWELSADLNAERADSPLCGGAVS